VWNMAPGRISTLKLQNEQTKCDGV
jgi:hypothetical protein